LKLPSLSNGTDPQESQVQVLQLNKTMHKFKGLYMFLVPQNYLLFYALPVKLTKLECNFMKIINVFRACLIDLFEFIIN